MRPPFEITLKINNLVGEISKLLGSLEATSLIAPDPKLRRKNQIRTIKSTLAIEGHTFTENQIIAVLEHKHVLGTKKEILEVKNAIELYDLINDFKSFKGKDFLRAHKILMKGLISSAGRYRSKNVGILKGTKVKHLAPKPIFVPEKMGILFEWLKKEKEVHPLIASSIMHYEIEFIHPFEDGNGRMGRFWQALILNEFDNLFRFVPVESLIEKSQKAYYLALEKSDQKGDSTFFIEFMLKIIFKALKDLSSELIGITLGSTERLQRARNYFGKNFFNRKDYMLVSKSISTSTASRDLKKGIGLNILEFEGKKNQKKYRFK